MSDTEPLMSRESDSPTVESLRSDMQALNGQMSFVLVLMFIFTVCVNIFLWRQAADRINEANGAELMVNNFKKTGEFQARDLWFKLGSYASTHPDFEPIYNKWSHVISIHTNAAAAMPVPKK